MEARREPRDGSCDASATVGSLGVDGDGDRVRIVGLLRVIPTGPTGTLCPPFRLEDAFFNFRMST